MSRFIMDYLNDAAKVCPDKIAFEDKESKLTYAETYSEAVSVANFLDKIGVKRKLVMIFMQNCVDCVAAMYGVAYSGNYYTIANNSLAENAISELIEIAKPAIIITHEADMDYVGSLCWGIVDTVLAFEKICSNGDDTIMPDTNEIALEDPIAVFFTSGSTGKPKGVVLSHLTLMQFQEKWSRCFASNEELRIGETNSNLFASFSFYHVWAVAQHAYEYIFSDITILNMSGVLSVFSEKKINTVPCITSFMSLAAMFDDFDKYDFSSIKQVIFCGERISVDNFNKWYRQTNSAKYYNLYAASETYLVAYKCVCGEISEPLSIGLPTENVRILILDKENKEVPPMEVGEMYIKNQLRLLGYYNEPMLTSQYLVQNPVHNSYPDIVCRTGDLAYRDKNGEIHLIGRADSMIKRNGYRIELGELEHKTCLVDGVRECICLFEPNQQRIFMFYESDCVNEKDLYVILSEKLRSYMLPDVVRKMNPIPRNANGKLDRAYLKQIMQNC